VGGWISFTCIIVIMDQELQSCRYFQGKANTPCSIDEMMTYFDLHKPGLMLDTILIVIVMQNISYLTNSVCPLAPKSCPNVVINGHY
jgi:hypothetical protein